MVNSCIITIKHFTHQNQSIEQNSLDAEKNVT